MKTVKIKLADGQLAEMQMSDEEYKSFKEVQRPYWREEKRKQRRGLSLEQFLEDNDFEIADVNPAAEEKMIMGITKKQKHDALMYAIEQLLPEQQMLVRKKYIEGFSQDELAIQFGIDKTAISHRFERIYKQLRKHFEDFSKKLD